jgi:2-polyprenyl-3-methyl-5-hydroxy-6-metoxy-1,4-benzoquinol methylase
MRHVADLSEVEEINRSSNNEAERVRLLCEVYWLPKSSDVASETDPFTREFLQLTTQRLNEITRRKTYDAFENEKAPYLAGDTVAPVIPGHYSLGQSAWAGELIQSHGAVLKALAMLAGQSILEYGPGDGQIALHLSRLGCRVTVVDIEARYLARIRSQASDLHTQITTIEGVFGDAEINIQYDRILFFEAFHHALDHHGLVKTLRNLVSPSGFIVLAGEPVLEHDNYFRPTLPYAWGPRLDGLSLRAMQSYGWCELGFTREYFVELWMRAGFLLTFRKDAATDRGSAYIATPRVGLSVDIMGPCLLEAWGFPDCWYQGEGTFRWSKTETCAIPLDEHLAWKTVIVTIQNSLPVDKKIRVISGSFFEEALVSPGDTRTFRIFASEAKGRIILNCPLNRPCDLSSESSDTRHLGLALLQMTYET